jgi:hypothetical protein
LWAYTSHGVKYHTGQSRLSGSPETSAFNTLENAFIVYLGMRMSVFGDRDVSSHERAMQLLERGVVVGGDDSLIGGLAESFYCDAARKLGHVATAITRKRCDPSGVTFLSRQYSPYVWGGDASSCACLRRALRRFCTASHLELGQSFEDKAYEKAESVLVNDANTPILGAIAKNIVKKVPKPSVVRLTVDTSYNSRNENGLYGSEQSYPNENTDQWMNAYMERELPDIDYDVFRARLETADSLMHGPPLVRYEAVPQPEMDIVVNGEFVAGPSALKPERTLNQDSSSVPLNGSQVEGKGKAKAAATAKTAKERKDWRSKGSRSRSQSVHADRGGPVAAP